MKRARRAWPISPGQYRFDKIPAVRGRPTVIPRVYEIAAGERGYGKSKRKGTVEP